MELDNDKEIGARIRALRERFGVKTQEEMAIKLHQVTGLDVTPETISRWEGGSRAVSVAYLRKIATLFNVPMSYFFDEPSTETKKSSELIVEPVWEAVQVASYKGVVTPELVDRWQQFIKFTTDEEVQKMNTE